MAGYHEIVDDVIKLKHGHTTEANIRMLKNLPQEWQLENEKRRSNLRK